jgi:hypothetical protein
MVALEQMVYVLFGFLSFCFVFMVLGFVLRAYILSYSISTFCGGFFRDRVLRTICLGWLQTAILLISASWVTRITGVSHQHPEMVYFLL